MADVIRCPFATLGCDIFGLLLFAIGLALCFYGVNKSREIGGWAVFIIIVAGLWFWLAFEVSGT